jgi:UDP-glucuronate decarboxylase
MVEGLVAMMERDDLIGPVNLGNPHEISISELADKIIRATGSNVDIKYLPLPPDDPVKRCPDISLAKSTLQWQPSVDFDKGLSQTIDFFRHKLSTERR